MAFEYEIELMRLFIDKVEKLTSLSLVTSLIENGSSVHMSVTKESGVLEIATVGPTGEQVDAFVLTIRMFMQDNDRISIRHTSNVVDGLPVSDHLRKYFRKHRDNLNQYLDASAIFALSTDHPTRREVFDTVLYGNLSHLEATKVARYQAWVTDGILKHLVDFEFIGVIKMFLRTLYAMAEICRRTIWELEGNAPEDYPETPPPTV